MTSSTTPAYSAICATLLVAFLLAIVPIPILSSDYRPHFVALILIFWCISLPEKIGIAWAWCIGILLDAARGALLGQYALGLALMAYFCLKLHKRFRLFPLWQQSFVVLLLIGLAQTLNYWAYTILGHTMASYWFLLSMVTSAMCWPIVVNAMHVFGYDCKSVYDQRS